MIVHNCDKVQGHHTGCKSIQALCLVVKPTLSPLWGKVLSVQRFAQDKVSWTIDYCDVLHPWSGEAGPQWKPLETSICDNAIVHEGNLKVISREYSTVLRYFISLELDIWFRSLMELLFPSAALASWDSFAALWIHILSYQRCAVENLPGKDLGSSYDSYFLEGRKEILLPVFVVLAPIDINRTSDTLRSPTLAFEKLGL